MQVKEEKPIKPIEYLGGVMDEETRPLLKSYISQLEDGEAALVVFRRLPDESTDLLLESNIAGIAGHDWEFVAGGTKDDPMQELVNKLSKEASELRVANHIFSQGGAKIKAFDKHEVCFGLITNGNQKPITSIKGIVHQQLNMGLNGDLLMHEGDIIMQSLIDNNVFKQEGRDRPLLVTTYGAGGSSSHEVNPGIMAVSDGVIDIRSHIDPKCIMDYLNEYCSELEKRGDLNKSSPKGEEFYQKLQEIAHTIEHEPGYSGIAMVHDIADLSRKAAQYTGKTTQEIMAGMDPQNKRYYGEISFGNPSSGVGVIHRIDLDEKRVPFTGNDGQTQLLKSLQHFIADMSKLDENQEAYNRQMHRLQETVHKKDSKALEIADNINLLLVNNLSEDDEVQLTLIKDEIERLDKQILERTNFILDKMGHNVELRNEFMGYIKADETRIQHLIETRSMIYDTVSQNLKGTDLEAYYHLKVELDSLNQEIQRQSAQIDTMMQHHMQISTTDAKLRQAIELAKTVHEYHFSEGTPFSITASGNIFFTEEDKKAVGKYGAKLVEMENQLFVEIIHHSIANQVYVDKEFITKIAADPLKIDSEVTQQLNEWAATTSMTVQDYVDAFMWAKEGQSFEDFPESGRWTVAEDLFKRQDKDFAKLFYNFGTKQEPKIVNPFWKEIGTDLVKEIKEGKAFQGKAFEHLNFNENPLKDQKQGLVEQAAFIIANPDDEALEEKVKTLFTNYLELMPEPGMKLAKEEGETQKYHVYARSIPVLKKGYVQEPLSDWDQPLYKSSNTALLDKEASKFLAMERGKHIGGGVAIMMHAEKNTQVTESPNTVLYNIIKAERKKEFREAYKIAKAYLDKNPEEDFKDKTSVSIIEKIEEKKSAYKAYAPQSSRKPMWVILSDIGGFKPGTVAAPIFRVAEQLRKLSETNPKKAIKCGEEYLSWKNHKKETKTVKDIQSFVDKLKTEHSFKSIKDELHKVREANEPVQQKSSLNRF